MKKDRIALCLEMVSDPTTMSAPEWVELIPVGSVTGRDGRSWNCDPTMVLAAFSSEGKDLPIDWEHSSELKAPQGEPAPAAGWITAMEERLGAVWGKVAWTERGEACVAAREYRYLSPVFTFEKQGGKIVRLTSCGLTNQPNLYLSALNAEQTSRSTTMEEIMKKLLEELGLAPDCSMEEAMNACKSLKSKALNRETPSLDKYVPRADYDAAVARAANSEQKLQDQVKVELEKAINTEIEAALVAGKITPATKEYHVAQCRQEGGLERFKGFVAAAPVIAGVSNLDGKKPETDQALNAEELRFAAMFGNSAEDIKKYGKGE